jgi:hypothetical protein
MEIGLLWYDGDPKRSLQDKVERAADRYLEKYGRWPNTCYVNPEAVGQRTDKELRLASLASRQPARIRVLSAPNILLHHFWLGESRKKPAAEGGPVTN